MNVFDLSGPPSEEALAAAESALAVGSLVVLPTDTVYGVAARPDVPAATDRVFEAKQRPRGLILPVLVADLVAGQTTAVFDQRAHLLATGFWPGGVTLVLPRTPAARTWDLGEETETVGVRVPADDVALHLLERTGPLAVTSANRSGEPTPHDCEGVRAGLGGSVAVYLCAGRRSGQPSTVVDLTGPDMKVLRHGVVPAEDLEAALNGSGRR
jgi:L-threonylcarbamoyladenylate synthase